MPFRYLAGFVFGLAACEHIDEIADVGSPQMPAATEEPQRVNVDEIGPKVVRHAGVAPRTPSLADPRFTLPRQQITAFEDSPPPEPLPPMTDARRWFAGLSATERKTVGEICREGRTDPCFGMLRMKGGTQTRMDQLMGQLAIDNDRWKVQSYCHERDPRIICDTPLVVAFDERPVELETTSATFAFQPGMPVHTDWPTAVTPWIALDRDGDGAITSGAELFGDATVLPGGNTASNGFEALAPLDANHDGVVDRHDPMFARLLLWADRDGDRKSSAAELRPISEVIVAIPLGHDVVGRCRNGNCEGERAAITWRDATGTHAGAVIDVYLRRR